MRNLCPLLLVSLGIVPPAAAQSAHGDSVVYDLAPTSRLEVRTGKAGLFGFAGHEHLIRARSEEHTLNSSHGYISYAVFCLKKKKTKRIVVPPPYQAAPCALGHCARPIR